MKQRLKKLMFEITYIIPIFVVHSMLWLKVFESDFERLVLIVFVIPLSWCLGVSVTSLVRQIIDFQKYLKTRDYHRVTGIDICPKCRGEGWIDWIEQIKGKNEVKSGNG